MLRLGRPVGAYPRLEARLAAIHLGRREDEGAHEEGEATGCEECGGKSMPEEDACSDGGDTTDCESDCSIATNIGKAWDKSCWHHEFELDY